MTPETIEVTGEQFDAWCAWKMCGCGEPERNYALWLAFLEWHTERDSPGLYLAGKYDTEPDWPEPATAALLIVMLYAADNMGLTEHGGSVFGSWLTPYGIVVREVLRLMKEKDWNAVPSMDPDAFDAWEAMKA